MRLALAAMKVGPATRRMTAAARAQPAMIKNSLRPKPNGEARAVPRKTWVNRLAVSGVTAVDSNQSCKRERDIEAKQCRECGRRHQAGQTSAGPT